jgi:GNAT superfamily N-acetyltransferase
MEFFRALAYSAGDGSGLSVHFKPYNKHRCGFQRFKHMSRITVRQAVFSDVGELSGLFDLYRIFQGKESNIEAARSFLQARFDHGESVVFMAHEGSAPLGFAQLYPSYSSTALARVFILNDLFVHETGRRKGAASKLLAALEGYALAHGAARVTLNVAMENKPGRELYESHGWSKDEQFVMYHSYPGRPTLNACASQRIP